MRGVLLGVAASIAAFTFPAAPAPAAPPNAQGSAGSGFTSPAFPQFTRSPTFLGSHDDPGRDRHDRRRHRDFQGNIFLGDREYQGDTLWRPDGFNDWWHERPERSYPAWMSRNQNCERLWWSGGGWRC